MKIILPVALVATIMLSGCGSNEPTQVGYSEFPPLPANPTAVGYGETILPQFPKVCK